MSAFIASLPTLGRQGLARHGFLAVVAVCFVGFAVANPSFVGGANLVNILSGAVIPLIVGLGMTLVVALGAIDLSVGIALDFGSAFAIVVLKDYGAAWYLAVLIGIAGGALIGLANAVLIVRLRISPFLATLGTFFIGGSLQRIFTHGGGPISYRRLPPEYYDIAVGEVFGIPIRILIAATLLIAYFLLLERSTFGKKIHAIGLQSRAARVAGLPVGRLVAIGFVLAGATAAVGGLVASANLRMFTPLAGNAYLMDAIAAVFIGASMHRDGRPNVLGTLTGVLFLSMVANGLNLMGLDFNLKDALSGLILVAALALSIIQHRRRT
ncbi:MAG: transporter permease [Proteobacteria bacterium]|nr:transporter permease [Pseudomonadota bacterium]